MVRGRLLLSSYSSSLVTERNVRLNKYIKSELKNQSTEKNLKAKNQSHVLLVEHTVQIFLALILGFCKPVIIFYCKGTKE